MPLAINVHQVSYAVRSVGTVFANQYFDLLPSSVQKYLFCFAFLKNKHKQTLENVTCLFVIHLVRCNWQSTCKSSF